MGSQWIAHSAFVRMGYWLRGQEDDREEETKKNPSKLNPTALNQRQQHLKRNFKSTTNKNPS